MVRDAIILVISVLLGGLRIFGIKGEIFQAVAHLWIGILIGHAIATHDSLDMGIVITLSLVELMAFLLSRKKP